MDLAGMACLFQRNGYDRRQSGQEVPVQMPSRARASDLRAAAICLFKGRFLRSSGPLLLFCQLPRWEESDNGHDGGLQS